MGITMLPNGSGGYNTIITPSQRSLCPNCHEDEDIKKVCKHCGYVYPEPKNQNVPILLKVFIILLALFMVILLAFVIDHMALNSKYSNKITLRF